jgi:hypothetical protein
LSRIRRRLERSNARSDEILASRPTRWLVLRVLFGVVMAAKGVGLIAHATQTWQYALAPLLFAGGLMFAFESANILLARARGR